MKITSKRDATKVPRFTDTIILNSQFQELQITEALQIVHRHLVLLDASSLSRQDLAIANHQSGK
jgi:hypothetical protein